MVLEDFLFPQEEIRYQSKHEIKLGADDYVIYITNRRILAHKRKGFILKKDRVFSVALEEVTDIKYDEQGLINKRGILEIHTKTQKLPKFEGKIEDVKVIWREMQKYLQYRAGIGAPTAYTKPPTQSGSSNLTENEIPKGVEEAIKQLKLRLAKGEITEEEYLRLRRQLKASLKVCWLLPIIAVLTLSLVFAATTQNEANAKADISVAMKAKKKIALISIKNNGDPALYSVEIKSKEGTIRSIKAKDWDRQKIDASTVMIQTDDKPLTKGRNLIILLIMEKPFSSIEWKAFDAIGNLLSSGTEGFAAATPVPVPQIEKPKQVIGKLSCKGNAACFTAIVTAIVDGDTIDVNDGVNTVRIRLALTNTPEKGQPLYNQAVQFTASLCSVGSIAGIDEDDGQREGSYDRMIAKVFCSNKILNAELLYATLAVVDQRFCNESEFAKEVWAQQYGCKQTVQQTPPQPPSVTPPPTPPKETEKNCHPSYPDVCIPPPPPDLDCDEIPYRNFRVLPPDPHGFDRDKDGIGCET